MLADEGVYVASESSFSRVLRAHGQTRHRGRAKAPQRVRPPSTHVATAPRQVFCWDMTYLPATAIGRWFYLYLILDLYSRKIVGFEVHETDDRGGSVFSDTTISGRTAVDFPCGRSRSDAKTETKPFPCLQGPGSA